MVTHRERVLVAEWKNRGIEKTQDSDKNVSVKQSIAKPTDHRKNMEPDQSGAEQTSPRGNDWEVVQLTASTYASAPGPRMSEPSEEAEVKGYDTKGDDSAAALLMSGHFSASPSEVESLLKERQKELYGQDAGSAEGDDEKFQETCEHKLKDDLHCVPSFDKGKNLSLVDMEFDNGKTFQGMGLVGEEPLGFSSSRYNPIDAKKELSWSVTESKNEKKTEEPTVQNVNRVIDSSKVVASSEQNKPDDPEFPRKASWKKQLLSLYKNVRKNNKFWPIVVAATALVGVTCFWRRWQKGKLQHQPVKLYPSSTEKINQAVGPLNRIKDILAANNHPTPAIHRHARLS
uniref:ATG8-interacting protein 1 n=1 Tax=Oryza punctata TaxID=4537 RepID=A0A0E0K714_ORYPU